MLCADNATHARGREGEGRIAMSAASERDKRAHDLIRRALDSASDVQREALCDTVSLASIEIDDLVGDELPRHISKLSIAHANVKRSIFEGYAIAQRGDAFVPSVKLALHECQWLLKTRKLDAELARQRKNQQEKLLRHEQAVLSAERGRDRADARAARGDAFARAFVNEARLILSESMFNKIKARALSAAEVEP